MVPPARHLPGQLVGGGAEGGKHVLCQLWGLGGRSAGSQQRPLLRKASPELPGVPEGAGPPCVLLCDSCAWGLHACVGSWSHAGRGPGALGCDFALFESGCPAPPCVGGEGHPPHCPPRWGRKPLAFPLLGAGVGPVLPPLWVSRLGDCQVTAADTALGIRARLRAPRPPHTTSVHAVPHATCLSSRRPLWSLHLSFPSDARSHSPALGEACAFLFLPTSCGVPEGRGWGAQSGPCR